LKLRHRKMCRARMRGNHLVKREYVVSKRCSFL
jgi:hypothetical protein